MTACACCGAEVDESGAIDLDLGLPPGVTSPSFAAGGNVLFAGSDAYVRCVLPVELTGDLELWFGAWMQVSPDQARHAADVWDGPGYASLKFTGTFAHDLKPWDGLRGVPVTAEVREPGDLPEYVSHPLLGTTADRDEVLSGYLVALPISIRQKLPGTWSIERTAGLTPARAGGGPAVRRSGPRGLRGRPPCSGHPRCPVPGDGARRRACRAGVPAVLRAGRRGVAARPVAGVGVGAAGVPRARGAVR
ncbi:hypothetical protein JNUCC0626_15900 [Lentzea sp. JNUCC 0626]|uniref:hypothetical protein n=1 Tax=Lentzea sp. JNUCC 0626 TaxID=3367513 RepID=UPI003749E238